MKGTQALHALGQSLWLDNMTRELVTRGTLKRYVDEFSVTGLTSNPSIFDQAVAKSHAYDEDIARGAARGLAGESLFFELATADLVAAAALFKPAHEASGGLDGWVSLEVSPRLAYDAQATVAQARALHAGARCDNLMIKIPGTAPGLRAIEDAIFDGIPINVTLLFSAQDYVAAAEAYLRGLERRLAAGLSLDVTSVASLFVSRWDKAILDKTPEALHNRLGLAMAARTYRAYHEILRSERWRRLASAGARVQRLLWASTATKDPSASDVLYVEALAAPGTINTLPEDTLRAFADHGRAAVRLTPDGGDAESVIAQFREAGVDVDALGVQLQVEGAHAFGVSWDHLLATVSERTHHLKSAGAGR